MTGGQGHRYVAGVPVTDHVLDRWRQLPPLFLDAALAAVVAAVTIVSIVVEDHNDHGVRLSAFGWALLALQLVPLVWRRRALVVVLGLSMGGAIAYGMARLPDPAIMVAPSLAVYSVAAHRPHSVSVPCALVVAGRRRGGREDACGSHPDEARPARPRPGGDLRLRVRVGRSRGSDQGWTQLIPPWPDDAPSP
jgi:hypothetical protein